MSKEENLFDPETGKPLNANEAGSFESSEQPNPEADKPMDSDITASPDSADLFDPETGRPLDSGSSDSSDSPDLFDPETGRPLNSGSSGSSDSPDLFDPETSRPLNSGSSDSSDSPDLFDPETGRPLNSGSSGSSDSPDLFDPETGRPLSSGFSGSSDSPDLFDPETGRPLSSGFSGSSDSPDLFDPETGKPIKSASAPKPGKSVPKPLIIVGAAAAGVCAVAVITTTVLASGMFKNKKDIVSDAIVEIFETADEGFLEDTYGLSNIRQMVLDDSVHMGLSLQLDDIPLGYVYGLGSIDSAEGSLDFSRDKGNNAVLLSGTLGLADMDIGSANIYLDDKTLAANVPELSDVVFTLNYDQLPKKLEDSYLGEIYGAENEDGEFAAAMIKDTNQMLAGKKKRFRLKEIYDNFKETTKAANTLKESLEIEKLESKKFRVNGKEQNCKGYHVVVRRKAMADFVKTAGKYLASDSTLKENEIAWLTDVLTSYYMLSGRHHDQAVSRAESNIDDLIDGIRDGSDFIEDFIDDNMDDLELDLYVDKKGHAVFLGVETTVDVNSEYDVTAQITMAGGPVPLKNVEADIDISGRDSLSISYNKSEREGDRKWNMDTELRISADGYGVKISSEAEFPKGKGDFEIVSRADIAGQSAKVTLEGEIADYKKGRSIEGNIFSLKVSAPYVDWGGLSGSFVIEPLSGKVSIPSGTKFDILEADEYDWEDVGDEIESNAEYISSDFAEASASPAETTAAARY